MLHRSALVGEIDFQHKFGRGFGITASDLPVDIWDMKSIYPFPASAHPTTLVCDDTEDEPGKTGALTTSIFGLDHALKSHMVLVPTGGQNEVPLPIDFYRIFRVNIETAGSHETNVGNIDVKHGDTILARVQPGYGSTLMATYTISTDYQQCYLKKLYLDVSRVSPGLGQESIVTAHFQYRKNKGAWQVKHPIRLSTDVAHWDYVFPDPGLSLPPGSDLRWRILDISTGAITAFAGFDLREVK
jgi:hypothetical protein